MQGSDPPLLLASGSLQVAGGVGVSSSSSSFGFFVGVAVGVFVVAVAVGVTAVPDAVADVVAEGVRLGSNITNGAKDISSFPESGPGVRKESSQPMGVIISNDIGWIRP